MAVGYKSGAKTQGALKCNGTLTTQIDKFVGTTADLRIWTFTIDTTLGDGLPEFEIVLASNGAGITQTSVDSWQAEPVGAGNWGFIWNLTDAGGVSSRWAAVFSDGTVTRNFNGTHTFPSGGTYNVWFIGDVGVTSFPDGAKVTNISKFGQVGKRNFTGPLNTMVNATVTAGNNDMPILYSGPRVFDFPLADFDGTYMLEGWLNSGAWIYHGGSALWSDMSSFTNLGVGGVNQGVDLWRFPSDLFSITGTVDSISTNQLVDTTATFVDDGVNVRLVAIKNTTTGATAIINGTATQTTITLKNLDGQARDIFQTIGDGYEIVYHFDFQSVFGGAFQNWSSFNHYIGSWNLKGLIRNNGGLDGWVAFNNGDAPGASGGGVGLGMDTWDVSYIYNFGSGLPARAAFNQYVNSWNVGNCIEFSSLFLDATSFNQPLNNWRFGEHLNAGQKVSLLQMLRNCTSFDQDLSDWTMEKVGSASRLFQDATSFNNGGVNTGSGVGLDTWNVSAVTDFTDTFFRATAFNCDLGNWSLNTTETIAMRRTFFNATSFTGTGLGNWNTSKVKDWRETFLNSAVNFPVTHPNYWELFPSNVSGETFQIAETFRLTPFNGGEASGVGGRNFEVKIGTNVADEYSLSGFLFEAVDFNQDVSTDSVNGYWVMTRVVNLSSLFRDCTNFNQDIGNWDTSNCLNFNSLFQSCTNFDQELTNWDTSSATDMGAMFYRSGFTNDGVGGSGAGIDTWDVSSVVNMNSMFRDNSFPHILPTWNTGNVEDMTSMFYSSGVSADIASTWDVSSVVSMNATFRFATNNPNVGSWNTVSVENMNLMFQGCPFNRDISGWSIASLTTATDFTNTGSFTTTNYDLLLDSTTGWASQATIQSGVSLGVGSTQYTLGGNAQAGRAVLTGTYSWTIVDGGGI